MTDPLPLSRGSVIKVVSDAGPIIHLDELGAIDLLADFQLVYVPDEVWIEVERHRPQAIRRIAAQLSKCSPPNCERVDSIKAMYSLHRGEYAALCQCMVFKNALLLTDDTAARLAAKALAMNAHGTIGLLLRALRRSHLSKDETLRLLGEIPQRSSLHVRPSFLAEIIEQAAAFSPAPRFAR